MKKIEEEKIVIDKDNYKGYAELYEALLFCSDEEHNCEKKWTLRVVITFLINLLLLMITVPLGLLSPIVDKIVNLELIVFFVSVAGVGKVAIEKVSETSKEKYRAVKEKYPYVDIDIKMSVLEKGLLEANIIQYKYVNDICKVLFKTEEYENYLKAEEIKEKYLEETKYNGYIINPPIEQEELEKVRVKVKSLTR